MKRTVAVLLVIIGIVAVTLFFIRFQKDDIAPITNVEPVDASNILSAQFDEATKKIKVTFKDLSVAEVAPYDGQRVELVEVVDVNYDGVDDLQVTESAGAYNAATYFLAQDPKTQAFKEYYVAQREGDGSDLPSLGFVGFDRENGIIKSSFKGRGLGDIYTEQTFVFDGGKWIKTESVTQDTLGDYLSESNSGYYVRTTVAYSGSAPVVKKEYFRVESEGDLWDFIPVSESEVRQKGLIK